MGDGTKDTLLPKTLMALQLGQIDLLMAMYASDDAILVDETSLHAIDALRDWTESDREDFPKLAQESIDMLLTLEVSNDEAPSDKAERLQLSLSVPLVSQREISESPDDEPPQINTRVQQPAWMNRNQVAKLNSEIPSEDILSVIEYVRDAASEFLKEADQVKTVQDSSNAGGSLVRVWFYFPSISTRSKRDDIVQYAPSYGLTGFLLAGKPGLLCLEGGSTAIDDFMKFIKTESWGDIPSHHKKVSERYRETGSDVQRAFAGMQEITDMIGERRGERANRNDMKAVEAWLQEFQLGAAFEKVLM